MIKIIREARDLSSMHHSTVFTDKVQQELNYIRQKDDLVKAWHGTNFFWCLYFCLYGIDGSVEPPTKTLGRGNMVSGFDRIKTNGLFLDTEEPTTFLHGVQIEVKPSELGISVETHQLGYTEGQELEALIIGDGLLIKPIPPRRIIKVVAEGDVYTRQEFIDLFDDPKEYIYQRYDDNTYNDDNVIRQRIQGEKLFDYVKDTVAINITTGKGQSAQNLLDMLNNILEEKSYIQMDVSEDIIRKIIRWLEKRI